MTEPTNILDAKIGAALDAGHIEEACLLAAQIPRPEHYLAAMRSVNEIIHRNMNRQPAQQMSTGSHRMSIEFAEKNATITKFETDKRVSDDETKEAMPIAEVDFDLNLPGDLLAIFSPTLRSLLFHKNGAVSHDLADQTHTAPDVRHPKIIYPLRWKEGMEGATVTIHQGLGGKSDLVLPEASIATFFITPNEGGTFSLSFTARAKLDQEKAFGRLAMLLKKDVTISLEPPEPAKNDADQ